MKAKQRGDAELMFSIIVTVVFLIGYLIFGSWSCSSKWEHSGMQTSWGPIKGCLVQTPNGYWIPDERIREVDLTPRSDEKVNQGGK